MEGNKLKVSDALSRLYSEEKHKISDYSAKLFTSLYRL